MSAHNPINAQTYDLCTLVLPDPAVGDDLSWAVPDNARIQVTYLGFKFQTDANVADRRLTVSANTGGLHQLHAGTTVLQTASLDWGWSFVAGLPQQLDLSALLRVYCPMSTMFLLEPGETLQTLISNIQATDHIYSIITRYKQWIIA